MADRITTLAHDGLTFDVTDEGLVLVELAPGVTVDEVIAATEPALIVTDDLKEES